MECDGMRGWGMYILFNNNNNNNNHVLCMVDIFYFSIDGQSHKMGFQ